MKATTIILISAACFAIGYGTSQYVAYQEKRAIFNEALLSSLLDNLAISVYASKENSVKTAEIADINIHSYLNQVRANGFNVVTSHNPESYFRALNGIALHWKKNPPFKSATWRQTDQDWVSDWETDFKENQTILKLAQSECKKHEDYECKKES